MHSIETHQKMDLPLSLKLADSAMREMFCIQDILNVNDSKIYPSLNKENIN